MKSFIVIVLAVVFNISIASPVLRQPVADKNLLLSEGNDSNNNHEETTSNNSQTEQKNSETNVNGESVIVEERPKNEEALEIDIVENVLGPIEPFNEAVDIQLDVQDSQDSSKFNLHDHISTNIENEFELVREGDYYYNDVIYKDPNEVMETAAGFVPIPIFRKKQRHAHRKQINTRRYNRRPYASRRHYYFYPYYGFHRPSSLRYYY